MYGPPILLCGFFSLFKLMKYRIKVKTNARKNEVVQNQDGIITVSVTTPPIEGKANEKMVELLSEFFKKPKRCISIVSGFKSKLKIVEIS